MRLIQIFNRYLKPGGEEKSVARIAEDLEGGGHAVTRFWRESSEWRGPSAPSRWRQPFLIWKNPAVLEALRREHAAVRADAWVLHNVVPVVSLGVYRLARELRVPVIQWLHNYRPVSPGGALFAGAEPLAPDLPWRSILWKETLAGSWNGRVPTAALSWYYRRLRANGDFASVRAWIAVSDEMRRIFARAAWYPERLFTLRHSWHAQPAPADPSTSPGPGAGAGAGAASAGDGGYFLFLGRMVETKGVRFLIDLWRRPELAGLKLVMAGEGPLADELRSQSPPNVEWVGHVEGAVKQRWKSGCRAILFPSVWAEPLSTVAYEAYELGKPIVATALGGMPEVVEHERTGLLLPASQPGPWLEAILGLSREPARAAALGAEGRRWLDREVSPRRWAEQFDAIVARAGIGTGGTGGTGTGPEAGNSRAGGAKNSR